MNASRILQDIPEITYRQLDHWVRKGYLRPDQRGGSGYARVFPGDEARVARTMARLVAAGLKPEAANRVARGHVELAPGVLVLVDQPVPAAVGELVAA